MDIKYYYYETLEFLKIKLYYYEIRAIFKPYNRIKVRNCPRTWTDQDNILFHGMFSVLCDFIERENKDWQERIKNTEDLWYKANNILNDLYVWYNSVDWNDPIPMSEDYKVALDKAVSFVQHDGFQELVLNDQCIINGKSFIDLRTEHNIKEKEFKLLKINYMKLLVDHHGYLWT